MLKNLFKRRLHPDQAAQLLLETLIYRYTEEWDEDVSALNSFNDSDLCDAEDGSILAEFILAGIALEMRAIINLSFDKYPMVCIGIFEFLRNTDGFGESAITRIQNEYLPAMRQAENLELPMFDGTLQVLFREIGLPLSPVIGTAALTILITKSGIWKLLVQENKIK